MAEVVEEAQRRLEVVACGGAFAERQLGFGEIGEGARRLTRFRVTRVIGCHTAPGGGVLGA